MKPTFVKQFRCESANRGMETPGLFQEKPAVLGDRLVTSQHMIERGCVHAVRMRALGGLIELLRIAKQDDGLRRL